MKFFVLFVAIIAIINQINPCETRNIMKHQLGKRSLRSGLLNKIHLPTVADIVTRLIS
jgi:hypothetical protein